MQFWVNASNRVRRSGCKVEQGLPEHPVLFSDRAERWGPPCHLANLLLTLLMRSRPSKVEYLVQGHSESRDVSKPDAAFLIPDGLGLQLF